jgi:hypothetical protein
MLFANQLVFSNNQIDHFGDDGIDYAASNLAITNNSIHDNLDLGDGNHPDAMRGQKGVLAPGYFQNILIDSNLIVRQTDPELSFPFVLQGIDAFDSDWTNVTVSNNVVVRSACWGIDFSSIHDGLIINNTVVGDGLIAMPCTAAVAVGDKTHEGPSSSNTALRNNLASRLIVYNLDSGVEADHNVIMMGSVEPLIAWYANGVIQYLGSPGIYANNNIIDSGGTKSEFVNFNPATLTNNLLLKLGADAIGAGTLTGARELCCANQLPRRPPISARAIGRRVFARAGAIPSPLVGPCGGGREGGQAVLFRLAPMFIPKLRGRRDPPPCPAPKGAQTLVALCRRPFTRLPAISARWC